MPAARPSTCSSSTEANRVRKPFLRAPRDHSQSIRRGVQVGFLVLNLWLGVQFCQFVRQFEQPGHAVAAGRPAGVEGWLPIAGLMNLKYFLLTGDIPRIHPAAMVLLVVFVASSLLLRKAFCGWLCPVGTLSEWLWKLGRALFGRNWALPRWLDLPLRALKYVLLGLFVWAVAGMTAEAIAAFLESPYGIIVDVKMLNLFRHLSTTGAIVLGVLTVASLFIRNFWCRYLCPYGALMGLAALASPLRIRRTPASCIDCAKCAVACPSRLPVDRLVQIRSAECLGCLECVAACPAAGALEMSMPENRKVAPWMIAASAALLFFGVVGWAKWTGHWESPVPDSVYRSLIPSAAQYKHP